MTGSRRLHLGAFMLPVGIHTAWWRYPGAYSDANFKLKHLIRFAQKLEQGRFDAWFMADHLAVLNMPMAALKRSATVTSFDPLTLLPALAMVTEHLGLIATAVCDHPEIEAILSGLSDLRFHIALSSIKIDAIEAPRRAPHLNQVCPPGER